MGFACPQNQSRAYLNSKCTINTIVTKVVAVTRNESKPSITIDTQYKFHVENFHQCFSAVLNF